MICVAEIGATVTRIHALGLPGSGRSSIFHYSRIVNILHRSSKENLQECWRG